MNKSKLKTTVIIFIPIIIIFFILLNGYIGIYSSTTNNDISASPVIRNYSIIDSRSFHDDLLTLTIDTKNFNNYINSQQIIENIEFDNSSIHLNSISIDSAAEEVLFNISTNNNKPIDIVADYLMSYNKDSIILDITPTSIGKNPLLISSIMLNSLKLYKINIPLKTNSSNLYDSMINQLLYQSDVNISISNDSNAFNMDVDISSFNLLYTGQLVNLNESNFTSRSFTENSKKYISITQAALVKSTLNSNHLQLLDESGYKNELLVNEQGGVYIRFLDTQSTFCFDAKLTLGVNDDSSTVLSNFDNLVLVSSNLSLDYQDDIEKILNKTFLSRNIDELHDYTVLKIESKSNEIIFNVEQTSWTIMIYLNGSDLESGYDEYTGDLYAKASEDLKEMMTGLESDNINLIIETGGTLDWQMPGIRSDINQRFKVENGELIHLEDLTMKNMTDPSTLIDFANFAIDNYPSEKYALLMWDHGGGSLYGFGVDEHFYGDSLTLDELEVALASITATNDIVFEVIGFDACLMATLEMVDVCAPYGNYLIASEETEPDYGWDYDKIFKTLADGDAYDGDSFGELVVSAFIDYSIEADQEEMLTLSVVDLSKSQKVVSAMNNLIKRISLNIDESDQGLSSVSRVIPQIKSFGGNTEYTGYTDHYDLENFAKKLTEYYPLEANRLITAIDSAVIYKASGYLATDAGGISFYLPFYDLYYEEQIDEMYSPVSFSEDYTSFMDKFIDYRINSNYDSSDLDFQVDSTTEPFTLTIGQQSLDYISNVYMNVLAFFEDDNQPYYRDLGFDAWVVETETVGQYEDSFSFWPTLYNEYLPIQVVYHGDDYIEYETPIYLNGEQATMISGWLYDDERYVIFGARPYIDENDVTNGIVDRNTIEFVNGDQIEILYDTYSVEREEWSFEPDSSFIVDLDTFKIQDTKFQSGSYGLQFVIEDYNGEFTFTDLYDFDY